MANTHKLTTILGNQVWKDLTDKGLVPPTVRRFIIDSGLPGEVVKVYYECFGDSEMIDVVLKEVGIQLSLAKEKEQSPDKTE